jgi:hypothetical protein
MWLVAHAGPYSRDDIRDPFLMVCEHYIQDELRNVSLCSSNATCSRFCKPRLLTFLADLAWDANINLPSTFRVIGSFIWLLIATDCDDLAHITKGRNLTDTTRTLLGVDDLRPLCIAWISFGSVWSLVLLPRFAAHGRWMFIADT